MTNKELVTIKTWEESRNLLQGLSQLTGKKMVRVLAEALVIYKFNLGLPLSEEEKLLHNATVRQTSAGDKT